MIGLTIVIAMVITEVNTEASKHYFRTQNEHALKNTILVKNAANIHLSNNTIVEANEEGILPEPL